jgi:hypothetical protein
VHGNVWAGKPVEPATRTERRRATRGQAGEPERSRLVLLIMGTFREMFGVRLSVREARRMFGLHETTCRIVLDDLVSQHLLRRTRDGRYALP